MIAGAIRQVTVTKRILLNTPRIIAFESARSRYKRYLRTKNVNPRALSSHKRCHIQTLARNKPIILVGTNPILFPLSTGPAFRQLDYNLGTIYFSSTTRFAWKQHLDQLQPQHVERKAVPCVIPVEVLEKVVI